MKNLKTTIIGLILSIVIAAEPILSGSGYHVDTPTFMKLLIAALIALKGYYSEDSK